MLIMLCLALLAKMTVNARATDDRVRDAIVSAIRMRMGAAASVVVDDLVVESGVDGASITALPEPGSRLGRAMRFVLKGGDEARHTGSATARVHVFVEHAHAAHALDRGSEIGRDDVVAVTHEITDGPLRALPVVGAVAQARTLRQIAADACITPSFIAAVPAVRGGRDVTAIARIDGVEATGTVTAAENGDAGAVIRVVNRQTRRALKARVLSAGLVEIIHD